MYVYSKPSDFLPFLLHTSLFFLISTLFVPPTNSCLPRPLPSLYSSACSVVLILVCFLWYSYLCLHAPLFLFLSACSMVLIPVCMLCCTYPCLLSLLFLFLSACSVVLIPVCFFCCSYSCLLSLLFLFLSACSVVLIPVTFNMDNCY
jgi:hypothetical protein